MSWYSGTYFWIGSVVQLDMSWYDKNKHLCRSMFVCVCACVVFLTWIIHFQFWLSPRSEAPLRVLSLPRFRLPQCSDRGTIHTGRSLPLQHSGQSAPNLGCDSRSLARSAARTQMWLESQKSLDYSKIIVPGAQRRVGSVLPPSQDQMQICKSAPSSTLHAATSWKKNRIRRVKYVHTVSVRSQIRIGNLGRYLSKQSN